MVPVPDTPEDLDMGPDPSHEEALVTIQPTQPTQPNQPGTIITEVTSSASLDQPPTKQVAQSLTSIPKLDFMEAIAALPSNYHLGSLELNTSHIKSFANAFAEHLKRKPGITEERFQNLAGHVNTQFQIADKAFAELNSKMLQTCHHFNDNIAQSAHNQ
jgi:hypothetical protein